MEMEIEKEDRKWERQTEAAYSHSIVAGGFPLIS
jgi:hypothetical protein